MGQVELKSHLVALPTKGFLAYEYNPFHNYRLSKATSNKNNGGHLLCVGQVIYKNNIYDVQSEIEDEIVTYFIYYKNNKLELIRDSRTNKYSINTKKLEKEYRYKYQNVNYILLHDDDGYFIMIDDVRTTVTEEDGVYKIDDVPLDEVECVIFENQGIKEVKLDNDGYYIIYNQNVRVDLIKDYNKEYYNKFFNKELEQFEEKTNDSGELVDLDTDKLNFSLNHPVTIDVLESYDGSVNLILNDNYNKPRMINSRFTPRGLNTYEIIDRIGNNDTNIYTDSEFDLDTSLYRIWKKIPKIVYKGLIYSGDLKVGNYVFYFKYADADGNETDFVGESGIIPVFIGNDRDAYSIDGGYKNMNANKGVQLQINNIDQAYDYLVVYYTRSYADLMLNRVTTAFKVEKKFVLHSSSTIITINGIEDTTEVPVTELNKAYWIASKALAQALCSDRLFLGNVSKPDIPYEELTDIALRMIPSCKILNKKNLIGNVSLDDYIDPSYKMEYYNSENVNKFVGYWPEEIYRFGVVFILPDNTHTSVFNVRGLDLNDKDDKDEVNYQTFDFWNTEFEDKTRNFIEVDEETCYIKSKKNYLENGRGVVRMPEHNEIDDVLSILFNIPLEVLYYLKNVLNIKGMYFVRQKRIPTILAQALLTPMDAHSHLPLLNVDYNDNAMYPYYYESFLGKDKVLKHEFKDRFRNVTLEKTGKYGLHIKDKRSSKNNVSTIMEENIEKNSQLAAICPEFEQNQPYYNQFFTGSSYKLKQITKKANLKTTGFSNRIFKYNNEADDNSKILEIKIISVTENVPTTAIEDKIFKLKAGDGQDISKFEYICLDLFEENNVLNLVRGYFGPYLGIKTPQADVKSLIGTIVNIYISKYSLSNIPNYFLLRFLDSSVYYTISEYFTVDDILTWNMTNKEMFNNFFRGDCYINQYTHRNLRNFNDVTSPNNDKIVNRNTWKEKYKANDPTCFSNMNRGDINAVQIGSWTTFKLRSTTNLAIRSVDHSYVSEEKLMGAPRSFFPHSLLLAVGENKLPESSITNDGFRSTVGERHYEKLADVPYYKNTFENRIIYSEIAINNAFKNGYRVFYSTNFLDYKKEYGNIVKLVELQGNILCVFEKAVGLIPVNERALAGNGAGGEVYINTTNVLPLTPRILSDLIGSQWAESIVKTQYYVYGVDARAKKIWRTNGGALEIISDLKVNSFLVNNLSLKERELTPIIGLRNVKTHYNANKSDIMFTFYDGKEGFEEKAWNLCYNEINLKFITFYSWIPSYSANVQNQFWSFDRDTSKFIAQLGASKEDSTNEDGVVLQDVVIDDSDTKWNDTNSDKEITRIVDLRNRILPQLNTYCKAVITYKLKPDLFGNHKKVFIETLDSQNKVYLKGYYNTDKLLNYSDESSFISELDYNKLPEETKRKYRAIWETSQTGLTLKTMPADPTYFLYLKEGYTIHDLFTNTYIDESKHKELPVIQFNIEAEVSYIIDNDKGESIFVDSFKQSIYNYSKYVEILFALYLSKVALTLKSTLENKYLTPTEQANPSLCTDFWIHGKAGQIDIKEDIRPTYWYGKQHPFEFEFIVNENVYILKIFENLLIIANKAEPESFHFEVVGEGYNFALDKPNIYFRLEATKELLQHLGYNILYDREYTKIVPRWNATSNKQYLDELYTIGVLKEREPKSTIFPLYYSRDDTLNELYDAYVKMNWELRFGLNVSGSYNGWTGTEITRNKDLNEWRVRTSVLNLPLNKFGRRKGNSFYKEDIWRVLIPSINFVLKNEGEYTYPKISTCYLPSIEKLPVDKDPKQYIEKDDLPELYKLDLEEKEGKELTDYIDTSEWTDIMETKIRDKYLKVRIRYSGRELAIIGSIITLYENSYA